MDGIFISYRREDSAGHSGRLFDRLRERFGSDKVFMDVADIEPGVDFVEAIDRAVGSCDVLLVIIGKKWLTCTDASGKRRLDDPKDFIRLEAAAALRRDIRVIPVLIQDATMPTEKDLPEDLLKLARRQATEISDIHWDSDTEQLIEALEKVLPGEPKAASYEAERESPQPLPSPAHVRSNKLTWIISSITAVVVALGGLLSSIESVRNTFSGLFSSQPEKKIETTVIPPAKIPTPQATVIVPNLIGVSLDAAVAQLRQERLQPGSVRGLTANRLPGTVMEQEPAPGSRLAPGTKVHLVIAEKPAEPEKIPEPELVAVPHLVGLSQESARAALKKAGLAMGKIKQVESREAKPGTVIEQIPPAGRQLIKGNAVTLVVAVEPPPPLLVTVPKLGGLTVEMAREALAREGLTTGAVQQKASSRSRPGTVIDQKPRPGQKVQKGTAVELVVATASPETGSVATPAPSKITVIAQGEPTSRRSWEGVKKSAYSARMARLYSSILKESASGSIEQTINTYSEHEMRVLEKMLRDPKRLCESTGSDVVFAARIQETYANSDLESAYWPELRQTAIVCNSSKQYEQRNNLSPGRTDQFPFETGMTDAMRTFAKEHRQLLK